jgi:hypothetical protein
MINGLLHYYGMGDLGVVEISEKKVAGGGSRARRGSYILVQMRPKYRVDRSRWQYLQWRGGRQLVG